MQSAAREESELRVFRSICEPGAKMVEGIPRIMEALLAFVGLIGSAPVIAVAAVAIKLNSRGTIFFRQIRVGRHGRPFLLVKLRTMRADENGPEVTSRADSRVTLIGRFLRKTKLDELPELWNVLKGDMSFVGPRPEVPRYVDLTDLRWQAVLQSRPGLTDPVTLRLRNEEELLAAVAGDVEHFYRETLQPVKLRGYLEYFENRSWKTDVRVMFKTAAGVIFPKKTPAPTLAQIQLEACALQHSENDE